MSKYPLIKTTLKERLLSGHYPEGIPLPSEPQLAREFDVSRMTARRAIDELEREGYVYRIQGAGTFSTGKRFRQGSFRIRSFKEWARHLEHRTIVLRSSYVKASQEMANVLQVKPGELVTFIHRLRSAGGEPLVIEKRYINSSLAPNLLDYDLSVESIHEVLISKLGLHFTRVEQTLEAVNLLQEEAELLRMPLGNAAFLLRRTTYIGQQIGQQYLSQQPTGQHTGQQRVSYVNYWIRGDRHTFQEIYEP